MKRLLVLLTIIILFSGGTKIKGIKTTVEEKNSENRLLKSVDSLQSATKKLEVATLKQTEL
jgi:hypothetical protein